jgi:hypothetical protein
MKIINPLTLLLVLSPITVSVVNADANTNANQFPPANVFDSRPFPKLPQQMPPPAAMKAVPKAPVSRTMPRYLPNTQQRTMPQRMQVPQRRMPTAPYTQRRINPQTSRMMAPGYPQANRFNRRPVSPRPNVRNNYPRGNNNSFPFGNNMMPFGNQNNGFNPFSNNSMPFSNGNGMMPTNPMKNMFGSNTNTSMPFFPSSNNKRKKAWGTERNIWPDFYTDFTDEAWDTVMSGPRKLGTMPGGWRFPYISMPDPVTVSDAIANQFPPIAEEAGKMADFSDWGVFDNK